MDFEDKDLVKEPFTEYGVYSYADYLTWEIDEMVELIKGKVFRSAATAPRRKHQEVAGLLHSRFLVFLEGRNCKVFIAPFDVRLPSNPKRTQTYLRWFSQMFV